MIDINKLGISLYTINKEAKKDRDIHECISDILYNHESLNTEMCDELKKQGFSIEDGVIAERDPWMDDVITEEIAHDRMQDAEYEYSEELDDDEIQEIKDTYDAICCRCRETENKLHKIMHDAIISKKSLYDLKSKVIENAIELNIAEKLGTHKFGDGNLYDLYRIGNFTFHMESLADEENLGIIDDQESSENTLDEGIKITVDEAVRYLNDFLDNI